MVLIIMELALSNKIKIMELAFIREKHDLIGKPVPLHNYPPDIYECKISCLSFSIIFMRWSCVSSC